MRIQWMAAAILSLALLEGCTDRGAQTDETINENGTVGTGQPAGTGGVVNAPAAAEPAQASSPNRDARPTQPRRDPAASVQNSPRVDESAPSPRVLAAPTPEAAPAAAPRALWREVTLSAGTSLPLELMTALSSETAAVDAPVRARLREAVTVDGVTVMPAGTVLVGQVTDVARPGRV